MLYFVTQVVDRFLSEVKLFSDLGRYRKLKEIKPHIQIAVGGCVASQEGEEIIKRAPYVDAVFGPQTLHRLPELINLREVTGKPQIDISFPEIEKFDKIVLSPGPGIPKEAGLLKEIISSFFNNLSS